MVCGAATPCSSGGRSAVAAINGTPLWCASTTAGCSSTAAVPLLVSTTAGRSVVSPSPSATKPALRSSWCTCTVIRASDARATANGVDRDPGHTTVSVTPARTHSSTRVTQNVAAVVVAMPSYPASVATLVLVHGFTQNRRCWGSIPATLAREHEVITLDAPGHGQASELRADLWGAADLLTEAGGSATYLGYSMGARMALHVALAHPAQVERLILVSGTPGIEDDAERTARVERDEALAQSLERDGLDSFLTQWLDQPLFATLPVSARDDEARRENTVQGLASSLRLAGTGRQEPLWDRLAALAMPVLLVAGALDERYVGTAARMKEAIGTNAKLHIMEGVGHACHREHEDEFADLVLEWGAQGT